MSDRLADVRAEPDPLKRANLVRDRRQAHISPTSPHISPHLPNLIRDRSQELAREAEAGGAGGEPSVRCEVQEMWTCPGPVLDLSATLS